MFMTEGTEIKAVDPKEVEKRNKRKRRVTRLLLFLEVMLTFEMTATLAIPLLFSEEGRVTLESIVARPQQLNGTSQLEDQDFTQIVSQVEEKVDAIDEKRLQEIVKKHETIASLLYEKTDKKITFMEFFEQYLQDISKNSQALGLPIEVSLSALTNTPVGRDERDDVISIFQEGVGFYAHYYGVSDLLVEGAVTIGLADGPRLFNNMSLGQLDVEPVIMARGLRTSPEFGQKAKVQYPDVYERLSELDLCDKQLTEKKIKLRTQIEAFVKEHSTSLSAFWNPDTQKEALAQLGITDEGIDRWYKTHYTSFWYYLSAEFLKTPEAIDKAMESYAGDNRDLLFLMDVALAKGDRTIWTYLLSHTSSDEEREKIQKIIKTLEEVRASDEQYMLSERKATLAISKQETDRELSVQLALLATKHWDTYARAYFGDYDALTPEKQRAYLDLMVNLVEYHLPDYGMAIAQNELGLRSDMPYTPGIQTEKLQQEK